MRASGVHGLSVLTGRPSPAHLEAWLVGLYIHYGGFEAVERVAQDTRNSLESTHNEAEQFDRWLLGEQKSARKRVKRIERANQGIAQWKRKPSILGEDGLPDNSGCRGASSIPA